MEAKKLVQPALQGGSLFTWLDHHGNNAHYGYKLNIYPWVSV